MWKRTTQILSLIALAGLTQAGCVSFGFDHRAQEERIIRSAVALPGPLTVQTKNGSIQMKTDATLTEIKVIATIRASGVDEADALARLGEIQVLLEPNAQGGMLLQAVFPEDRRGNDGCSFVITAPPVTAISIKTSNGRITVYGTAGHALLDTNNGAVELVNHDGSAVIDTSNGKIIASNITGDVVIDTSNGSLELSNIDGSVQADTSNGRIRFTAGPGFDGPFRLDTSNGSVTVKLPPDFPGTIRTDTSNGKVRVNGAPATARIAGSKSEKIVRLTDAAVESIADTSNGSVTIEFVSASEDAGG